MEWNESKQIDSLMDGENPCVYIQVQEAWTCLFGRGHAPSGLDLWERSVPTHYIANYTINYMISVIDH
jgi:hypothetical protein